MRIMRVGSDGSSLEISLGDWVQDLANGHSTGSVPDTPLGTLITNADQGVLHRWALCLTGVHIQTPTPRGERAICAWGSFRLRTT
jgi:hypothetical protein